MSEFTRGDGRTLRVVPGFREVVLAAYPSKSPRPGWSDHDYEWAAQGRVKEARERIAQLVRLRGSVDGIEALEIGCGAGIDCLVTGLEPVRRVVGFALTLPLFERGERGEQARRLVRSVLDHAGVEESIEGLLERLPVELAVMDATRRLPFPDESFDFVWSRATLEHVAPLQPALAEVARVVRPGGLVRHAIDPYFWLRGCHRKGVVDIPWAHARLSVEELSRFVVETTRRSRGVRLASWLASLNRLTVDDWRAALEVSQAFDVVEWSESRCPRAEAILGQHPEVFETVLPGVSRRDLTCRAIHVWLRRRG